MTRGAKGTRNRVKPLDKAPAVAYSPAFDMAHLSQLRPAVPSAVLVSLLLLVLVIGPGGPVI
jgi:hypothetical protein